MILDVKYDSNLADMKRVIQNGGIKSMSHAINDALSQGKTHLDRCVRSIYAIKQKDFKDASKLIKCYPGDLQKGKIIVESRRLSSYHFSFTPKKYKSQKGIEVSKRKKAAITIKKGQKKAYIHGFVVNPASLNNGYTLLWERNGNGTINPIRSVSVAQMVSNVDAYNPTQEFMSKVYDEKLEEYLKKQFKIKE